jgi:hypothetical protein
MQATSLNHVRRKVQTNSSFVDISPVHHLRVTGSGRQSVKKSDRETIESAHSWACTKVVGRLIWVLSPKIKCREYARPESSSRCLLHSMQYSGVTMQACTWSMGDAHLTAYQAAPSTANDATPATFLNQPSPLIAISSACGAATRPAALFSSTNTALA